MDREEYEKAYGYALAQEKVEAQLDLASLKAEQEFIRSNERANTDDHRYNEKRIAVLKARLQAISELESAL